MGALSGLTVTTKLYGLAGLLCILVGALSSTSAAGPLSGKAVPAAEDLRLCGDLQNWSCSVQE